MSKYNCLKDELESINFEKLDLKNANILLKKLENRLDYLNKEKELAFINTQPKATVYDKELVSGGVPTNKSEIYLIRLEEIEPIIKILNRRITYLTKFIENELKIIGKYGQVEEQVIYLREDTTKNGKKLTWEQISMMTNYSSRQCQRIYNKYKNKM